VEDEVLLLIGKAANLIDEVKFVAVVPKFHKWDQSDGDSSVIVLNTYFNAVPNLNADMQL